jgi:hypothetical protein
MMTFVEYEQILKDAVSSGFAQLTTYGKSKENDPIYGITISDFSIPKDEKFNILIAGLHVGGERAALNAAIATIKFLLRKSSRKYLSKYAITLMPVINPYGCFRKNLDQYHKNSSGFDPYVGKWGQSFNYPSLSLTDKENEPELVAFLSAIDKIKPEVLLDWHGTNGKENELMRETLGASLSNHFIMPWATRLLNSMRKEVCKGNSAVFDLEEYLERIAAPNEFRQMFPNRVRPSNAVFYPDLYAYIKYHTLPIVMEIAQAETGYRALKGLMDYGYKVAPEYRNSLPVNHIGTDFGNLVVASYGTNPGQKRQSRCELQSKIDHMLPFYASPMYLGEMCAALALGPSGIKEMVGTIPLREMQNYPIKSFPVSIVNQEKVLYDNLTNAQSKMLLPLLANINYDDSKVKDIENIQNGLTLQMFIPIGRKRSISMTKVLLNGQELLESSSFGYQLIKGSDAWHLFINLPPKYTKNTKIYHIYANYQVK